MATIHRFEDLEIWQLAREQVKDFNNLVLVSGLGKNFSLRNQMDTSSGSVMDCIAEGFERSGNKEFSNFILVAKASNGEYRSQLYRCLDRGYVNAEMFKILYDKNTLIGKKIMSFADYLLKCGIKGYRYK